MLIHIAELRLSLIFLVETQMNPSLTTKDNLLHNALFISQQATSILSNAKIKLKERCQQSGIMAEVRGELTNTHTLLEKIS